ncbi:LysR family transcriptional regulator [Streptomyces sp. B-S-A8]|uniref:LysR family transcriptional regulator n=1 Tax=Streptomyces solicavernae TaxID=3043614 RepID=A0ABT6RZG3_9ACTN|nr:LysR family transcriptional regulator [Streptomyces sp. B-S-A8]MDI3389559.1 LysR family transcriptional regulator [Streptomyces sp. B-S-A8]
MHFEAGDTMSDPIQLRTFLTVARTLSFTHAAAELGVQQSTVSQRIRKLEQSLGREFFTRDTPTVSLTPDGESLVGLAQQILREHLRAAEHFAAPPLCGPLRFGLAEELSETGTTEMLAEFVEDNPAIRIELTVRSSRQLTTMLHNGALDLVYSERAHGDDGSTSRLAWQDELVLVGQPHTPIDPQRPLPLVLPSYPNRAVMRGLRTLSGRGRPWSPTATSSDTNGVWAAVRAGLGLAVSARRLVPYGLSDLTGIGRLPALGEIEFVIATVPGGDRDLKASFIEELLLYVADAPHRLVLRPDRSGACSPSARRRPYP